MSLYAGSGTIEINLQAQGYLPFTLLKDYGIHKKGATVWGKQRIDSTKSESNYVEVYGTREKIPHGNRFNTILKEGIYKATNENKMPLETKPKVTYSTGAISPEQRKKQIKTIVIVAIVIVIAYFIYKQK